jgi:acyl-coenzyme A thioesterase PaaI-like protein
VTAGRGYPDAAAFATPARLRLAAATRQIIDGVLTVHMPDDELERAADALEGLATRLTAAGAAHTTDPVLPRRHADYLPRSPLVGAASPLAPPFEYDVRGGRLHARGVFGAAYEGPPGYVHGGWVALAFDEALGIANVAGGASGMTGRLTIRYRRPTPLHTELTLEAAIEHVDGRRITTRGRLLDRETVTAEAEGLFVAIGAERALEYFGDRPATPEPVDPLP